MSSLVSDSGTSADLKMSSRVVAVVSATSAAAVAATAFVGSSSQGDAKAACTHFEMSAISSEATVEEKNTTDENSISENGNNLNISLMQSSPPPHSYRHSRAYRHFKNPPQPHMCIRTTTEIGEELFINVLSWTRIVIPQEPTDPIPLYGGMRVPPGSPRSPPIVYAVMANPEVLKDSGRHSKDPEERRAMVELMCDFVEAMNPGVKLVRNAVILKDRDITGELKDVWNAVQAQRDREREEQMIQQRQQQHFHNITTQQMFPKSSESIRDSEQNPENILYLEKVNKTSLNSLAERTIDRNDSLLLDSENFSSRQDFDHNKINTMNSNHTKERNELYGKALNEENASGGADSLTASTDGKDQTDATNRLSAKIGIEPNMRAPIKKFSSPQTIGSENSESKCAPPVTKPLSSSAVATETSPNIKNSFTDSNSVATSNYTKNTPLAPTLGQTTAPTKKEKLVGFLPNGCIFPRFKNNKNKEKDKDKEKETKTKDKEKTLLNALKKSKDKKAVPVENYGKTSTETDSKISYEKNCISLETGVHKLDLNKIETPASADNLFVKLKITGTSATTK